MAAPLETNKHVFYDTDGRPLQGGHIYIGQPSTDPRTNKKTVTFRDAGGGEFTAAQPLKTIDGKIVYNGKPIVALVDGEHSMLILNSAGKQVDYLAKVTPSDSGGGESGDFNDLTLVGLTLSEVKAFDVSVGDLVRNVGKDNAQDKNGQEWLAVSATGGAADDLTLIDFNNGLQGVRVGFESLQSSRFKSAESPGDGDFDSDKLGYWEATVELGGDFDVGQNVIVTRVGRQVVISAEDVLTHSSSSLPESASGAIPSWARPLGSRADNFYQSNRGATIFSSGTVRLGYGSADTNTGSAFSLYYNV